VSAVCEGQSSACYGNCVEGGLLPITGRRVPHQQLERLGDVMIWPEAPCHSQLAAVIDGWLWEYEVTSWGC